jgi:predicted secreted protein with PEFG-CTERM motif
LLVLFAIVSGTITAVPDAFADHSEVTVENAAGSSVSGCEDTEEGCFLPSRAIVDVGGKVIFSNTDNVAHTSVSGLISDDDAGSTFDTSLLLPGNTYEWSPTEVGEYPYFCIVHPWMVGTIIVQEAGASDTMEKEHDGMAMDDKDKMRMMEKDPSATGMLSDGTEVTVWTSVPTAGEELKVVLTYVDTEHVNYDIMVTQDRVEVLNEQGVHNHEGVAKHMTAALESSDPVDIMVTFQGHGVPRAEKTGPVGEQVEFAMIVPEFGTIAMMVLAVAIISVVAVTAKSRVIPRI